MKFGSLMKINLVQLLIHETSHKTGFSWGNLLHSSIWNRILYLIRGRILGYSNFLTHFWKLLMRSDWAWKSVTLMLLGCIFQSFQTKSLCLVASKGNNSGQSISKECKSWMWAVFWKVLLITVSQWPLKIIISGGQLRETDMIRYFTGESNKIWPKSWYFTDEPYLCKAPARHSLVFAVGAGRRSYCTIRLDSELMGLPHCPGPVLYLTTYILSVWKSLVPFSTYELIIED